MSAHTALVTGATGYIGGLLVPRLLEAGYRVRVLARRPDAVAAKPWAGQVEVVSGDAHDLSVLKRALAGVELAYFLIHTMDKGAGFAERDRDLATRFGEVARQAGVGRIIYLGGLHPDGGELSTHLASRVEVGEVLLASGVPTAVLQAAVILGDGSASFDMLRYLTARLPVMIGPKWLSNRIQPIAVDDVLHYLVGAASLPPEVNRTFDIGGDEVLTYTEMIRRFADVAGLARRHVGIVPVLTPGLASLWIGLVTPVNPRVARPLVDSLVHEVVCRERDLDALIGGPPGGPIGYDRAVAAALQGTTKDTALRNIGLIAALALVVALAVGIVGAQGSRR